MKLLTSVLTLCLAVVTAAPAPALAQTSGGGYGGDPVTCVMEANPDTIAVGGGTTLTWSLSENVVSAVLSPKGSTSWLQEVALDGSWYISGIVDTREYTLTVTGPEGQESTCDALITVEDEFVVAPTCVIEADPSEIAPNGATTLVWDSSDNVVSATLHPQGSPYNGSSWSQSVPVDGSWFISGITDSRAYSLTVENSNGDIYTCDAPITVVAEEEEENEEEALLSCSVTAVPSTIEPGGATTLVWESTGGAIGAKISPEGSSSSFADVSANGSWYISGISNSRGYSITVYTEGGAESTCTAQIAVEETEE